MGADGNGPGKDTFHPQSQSNRSGWRSFARPLSSASVWQLVILNSRLSWFVQAGYLVGDPLSAMARRRLSGRMSVHASWM